MARLKGNIPLEGTLDNLSFYKTQDGIVVRQKWGPDRKRMKRDPAFSAVVNHGKDFGKAAGHSSFLRGTLRPLLKDTYDNRVTGRMNKLMLDLMKLDEAAEPGKRRMKKALAHKDAGKLLAGFEFNVHCLLRYHLLHLPALSKEKGKLHLKGKLYKKDLKFPKGATHAGIQIGWLSVDLDKRDHQLALSEEVFLDRKTAVHSLNLSTSNAMKFAGTPLFVLKLSFYKKTIFGMDAASEATKAAALVPAGD